MAGWDYDLKTHLVPRTPGLRVPAIQEKRMSLPQDPGAVIDRAAQETP
jgi:hypothetical protein